MNLVSLLIAPAVVSLSVGDDANTALRVAIALAAAAVIVGAVVFSKRRSIAVAEEKDTRPASARSDCLAVPAAVPLGQLTERAEVASHSGVGPDPPVTSPQEREQRAAQEQVHRQTGGTGRRLVIVESPTKAKTIAGYLGAGYDVRGQRRAHPRPADARASCRRRRRRAASASSRVDVDNGFEPLYVVDAGQEDEGRRAEAGAQGAPTSSSSRPTRTARARPSPGTCCEVLEPKVPVHRMVFHEITRDAIREAVEQHPRRSTSTWSTPRRPGASSTGSTATRSPRCCGARSARACRPAACSRSPPGWSSSASGSGWRSAPPRTGTSRRSSRPGRRASQPFDARLVAVDGTPGRHRPRLRPRRRRSTRAPTCVQLDEPAAGARSPAALEGRPFAVRSVDDKPYTRKPSAPFMTSTLQQEASRKLRLRRADHDAGRAAAVRERLHHLHAYRLDDAVGAGAQRRPQRRPASSTAPEYVPDAPRRYERKVKNAQEAHEAIRPAGDAFRTPARSPASCRRDEFALYELIWKRTVASQMADARGQTGDRPARRRPAPTAADAEFSASGTVITFRGFLAAYEEGARRGRRPPSGDDRERRLPPLTDGDALDRRCALRAGGPRDHARRRATPRPRWSRRWRSAASAARRRTPRSSGTILDRGYVFKKGTALVPTWLAFAVIGLLEQHFGAARRLRLHRRDGGGPRPDRQRRGRPGRSGCATSTSAMGAGRRRARRPARRWSTGPRRHRRPRGQLDPDRRRHRAAGRALRALRRARRDGEVERVACPRTSRRTS